MKNLLKYSLSISLTPLSWAIIPNLGVWHPTKKVVQGRGFKYVTDKSVVAGFDFSFLFLRVSGSRPSQYDA